jgi:hypothetical protein
MELSCPASCCGDYEGLGEKILKEYASDLRAHYARHAGAVLQQKQSSAGEAVQ